MGKVLLEPGDEFSVSYGRSGKTLKAICLGSRSRKNVYRIISNNETPMLEQLDKIEEAMKICFPGVTDDELDGMTHVQMAGAISDALNANEVDEEQLKK